MVEAPVRDATPSSLELEHYLDFFRFSSDLMCIAGKDFFFRKVNPAFERTLGYSSQELCSRPYIEFIHPDDHLKTSEDKERAFGPDGTMNFENRYIARDGSIVWLSWSARPSKTDSSLVFAIARNVTAQKRAEELLRESEKHLRLITENVPAVVAYVEAATLKYIFANRFYAEMVGRLPEEIIGRRVSEILPQEGFARAVPFIERARLGERVSYDNLIPFHGGPRWMNVCYTPEFDEAGKVLNIIVMAVDITKRKRVEEELDRRNGFLSALLENLPMGVFMVEAPSGKPVFANRNAMDLLGRGILPDTSERNLATVYNAFRLPERTPYPPAEMPIVIGMHGKRSHIDDMVVIRPDGRETPLEIFGSPVMDSQGKIWASLVSFWDISDRRRAQTEKEKLEAQNRQLQKAESLGRMAGAIAHHFNNQLQTIFGNLDFALSELPPGATDLSGFLRNAVQAAHRAAQVSTLMLTYLGQGSASKHPLDLAALCNTSLLMLIPVMPKNIVVEPDLPEPGPIVNASPEELRQVFTNLLTNAWEACPHAQAIVRVSARSVNAEQIPPGGRFPVGSAIAHPTFACLEIADPGCGIPSDDIEKIFDPFFSKKFTGRGMGLPVVLGIVRAHEGFIMVDSTPDRGSTFRVYLPLERQTSAQATVPTDRPHATPGKQTILVIEDEEPVRTLAARMLRSLGYSALTARDGLEGLEVFRRERASVACVLCDMTMPRMNGWETLSALRRIDPSLPILLVSGYSEAQIMNGNHPDQPQGFLSKPFGLERLREALRNIIDGKR